MFRCGWSRAPMSELRCQKRYLPPIAPAPPGGQKQKRQKWRTCLHSAGLPSNLRCHWNFISSPTPPCGFSFYVEPEVSRIEPGRSVRSMAAMGPPGPRTANSIILTPANGPIVRSRSQFALHPTAGASYLIIVDGISRMMIGNASSIATLMMSTSTNMPQPLNMSVIETPCETPFNT